MSFFKKVNDHAYFWIIWSVWWLSEILFNLLLRSGTGDKKRQDKGSISIIWFTIAIAITVAVVLSYRTQRPISHQHIIHYIGLLVIAIGMIFRFLSILSMGRLFTVDVTIRENHELKKDGVYKIMRHPSYSSSLLSFIGFGISLNNYLSLITITLLVTISFLYRIKIEEKALLAQSGKEYLEYKKTTYCLLPWVY